MSVCLHLSWRLRHGDHCMDAMVFLFSLSFDTRHCFRLSFDTFVVYFLTLSVSCNNMGKTSTQSKAKYNKDTYSSYIIRVRKDTGLYGKIEDFMSCKGTSLNYLVVKLLTEHFRKYE